MEEVLTMRGMSKNRIALLLLLAVSLSACAADGKFPAMTSTPYPPPGYAHQAGSSHVALYWNCTQPQPGALQLAGLAFNPWSDQPVGFLELELVGVDSSERTVTAAKAEARDFQLYTNQSTPFQLDMRTAGSEVRFDLYYQYRFQDRGHDADFAGPITSGRFLLAQQTNRFMVRDACSETQHRVR